MQDRIFTLTRRELFALLGAGTATAAFLRPLGAFAQSRQDALVVGMDLSDAIKFDPAFATGNVTSPIVNKIAYETLVTMTSDDYTEIKPAVATAWERTADGKGWRFTVREGGKFNSGNPLTVDDVKWSFDRVINIQDQPASYITNVEAVNVVDASHVDILLKDPAKPILEILCGYNFVIYDSKTLEQHGGSAAADAKTADTAGEWLTGNSCGTGAYTLRSFERGTAIMFESNPNYWGGAPPFQQLILRHVPDPAVQQLAIERGDIDVAFNLLPEQIVTMKTTPGIKVVTLPSMEMVYLGLSGSAEQNPALAIREARQAIGWAIDYDGIRDSLLAGAAVRAASVLPVGTLGSTPEVAEKIAYHQDLDKAKEALAKAGLPNGFTFQLSYGTALFAGVQYAIVAQKLQSDLARVGIVAELNPQDLAVMRTQNRDGKTTALVVNFGITGIDNWLWAEAVVNRIATRMHYEPGDLVELVEQAAREPDRQKAIDLWVEFQTRMAQEANIIPLFQPIYQIPVADSIEDFPLTAAGWQADFGRITRKE